MVDAQPQRSVGIDSFLATWRGALETGRTAIFGEDDYGGILVRIDDRVIGTVMLEPGEKPEMLYQRVNELLRSHGTHD